MSALTKTAPWHALALACAFQAGAMSSVVGAVEPPPDCQAADPRFFTDVAFDHPYCAWIEQFANHAISTGCAAGKYCPDEPVTRAQLAMLLERVMRGTDYWTSTPRIRFGCADPDSDCSTEEAEFLDLNVYLDDPGHPGTEHLVRLWFSDTPDFNTVNTDTIAFFSFATQFPSPTANVYLRVLNGANSLSATMTLNSPGTRYLMVEIGGRIFTSPALVWGPGET